MRSLIVCAYPGDEIAVFGNAVLASANEWHAVLACADPVDGLSRCESEERWRDSCRSLGIRPEVSLGLPRIKRQPGVEFLKAELAAHIGGYERIYVPDIQASSALRRNLCAAAAALAGEIWMQADTCRGAEVCMAGDAELALMTDTVNRYYAERLRTGRLRAADLRGVRQYRCVPGADLVRFAREFLEWDIAGVCGGNPWDLESSPYERDRYALELDALKNFPWNSLMEIGGCVGTFTALLCQTFPKRRLCVYEPNPNLYRRLHERLGHVVETVRGGAEDARGECDVLFVSSVLYYLNRFPVGLLRIPRERLVVSHLREYHDVTISPLLHSAGWICEMRKELPPRIEPFCGIPVRKDGTEVAVWHRGTLAAERDREA